VTIQDVIVQYEGRIRELQTSAAQVRFPDTLAACALTTALTHDLALTENVHMGSRAGGDPTDFDYRLKPGVTTETNALAIARLAGVPV
jgi:hypothetical protein